MSHATKKTDEEVVVVQQSDNQPVFQVQPEHGTLRWGFMQAQENTTKRGTKENKS